MARNKSYTEEFKKALIKKVMLNPEKSVKKAPEKQGDQRKNKKFIPANKLSEKERQEILQVSNSCEFKDLHPSQIVPILADRGVYIASESSFYRVLKANNQP